MMELPAGDDTGVAADDGGTVGADGAAGGCGEDAFDVAVPDWPQAVRTQRNPAARPIRFMTRERYGLVASYGSTAWPWGSFARRSYEVMTTPAAE
jgi:hypothetical protein